MVSTVIQSQARSVLLHEQIYTSAAELLEPGSGHLGIVASTRDFPRELAATLEPLRTYSRLPHLPIDTPAAHPPRIVIGPGGPNARWYCMTQVSHAGADHTGRTSPLAHHVAVASEDILHAHSTPAAVLRAVAGTFQSAWRGSPHWIEPPRGVPLDDGQPPLEPPSATLADAQLRSHLIAGAGVLVEYEKSNRPLVLIAPESLARHSVELLAKLLSLLPESVQRRLTCCSHVVQRSDVPRNCALAVTYTGTPYWEHASRREDLQRPVIFDLTVSRDESSQHNSAYAQALAADLGFGDRADHGHSIVPELWDDLGLTADRAALLPYAVQLRRRLGDLDSPAAVAKAAGLLLEVRRFKPDAATLRIIDSWCDGPVQKCVQSKRKSAWTSLCRIGCDPAWPEGSRILAAQLLAEHGERALPSLLECGSEEHLPARDVDRAIAQLTVARPELVRRVVGLTTKQPTPQHQQWADRILKLAACDVAQLTSYAVQIASAGEPLCGALLPTIDFRLRAARPSLDDLHQAERICAKSGRFGSLVLTGTFEPLVRERLEVASDEREWESASTLLLRIAARSGSIAQVAAELAAAQRFSDNPNIRKRWREAAEELGVADALEAALPRAEPPLPPEPPPTAFWEESPPSLSRNEKPTVAARPWRRNLRAMHGGWRVGPVIPVGVAASFALLAVVVWGFLNLPTWNDRPVLVAAAVVGGLCILWLATELYIRWRVQNVLDAPMIPKMRWIFLAAFIGFLGCIATGAVLTVAEQRQTGNYPWIQYIPGQSASGSEDA